MNEHDQDPLDARVGEYVRSRGDVPVPADLLDDVRARMSAAESRSRWRPLGRFGTLLTGSATVAVMLAIVLVIATLPRSPNPIGVVPSGGSETPSTSSTATNGSASPQTASPTSSGLAAQFPTTVLGLPVHTVAETVNLIATGTVNGRAIAVAGYWNPPVEVPCPAPDQGTPAIAGECNYQWITDTGEPVVHPYGDQGAENIGPPTPPYLNPETLTEYSGVSLFPHDAGPTHTYDPRPAVVIGHVGDPRSWECQGDQRATCQQAFIADRLVWLEGSTVDMSESTPESPSALSVADATSAAQAALGPGAQILSLVALRADQAPSVDPRLRVGVDGTVWVARAMTGTPDVNGTAAMIETVIDDASGQVHPTCTHLTSCVDVLSMGSTAEDDPASVALYEDFSNGQGNRGNTFYALDDAVNPPGSPDGYRNTLLTGPLGYGGEPVVLEPGAYRLRAWIAKGSTPGLGDHVDECAEDLTVTNLDQVSLTATFPQSGPCKWAPTVSRQRPTPSPSAPTPTPSVEPTPSSGGVTFPTEALGLPVHTVADTVALIAAAGGIDGRAIAVAGYWYRGFALPCPYPFPTPPPPIAGYCSNEFIVDSADSIDTGSGSPTPGTPYLAPRALVEAAGVDALDSDSSTIDGNHPRAVVVIGHVGDPRYWMCQGDQRAACKTAFVVDRLVWLDGQTVARTQTAPNVPPVLSVDQVTQEAQIAFGSTAQIINLVSVPAGGAAGVDPRLVEDFAQGTWIARAIVNEADAAGTGSMSEVLIDDDTNSVSDGSDVGHVHEQIPYAPSPDYQPASIQLLGELNQDGDRQLGYGFFIAMTPSSYFSPLGMGSLGGDNQPVVLVANGEDLSFRAGNVMPTLMPQPLPAGCESDPQSCPHFPKLAFGDQDLACAMNIVAKPLDELSFTATFTDADHCTWAPTPTQP